MADLLKLHLFQAKQWKQAETSLLRWDKALSDAAKDLCTSDSPCLSFLKFFTESLPLQIILGLIMAAVVWKSSQHLKTQNQLLLIGFLGAFFALGDFISNQLKYVFQRIRPDQVDYHLSLPLNSGALPPSYSFPSNHAFNLFALSIVLILLKKKNYFKGVNFPMALFSLAVIVGASRVFAWRHYPLDIVAGLLFGCLYAFAFLPFITKFVHAPKLTDKL